MGLKCSDNPEANEHERKKLIQARPPRLNSTIENRIQNHPFSPTMAKLQC